jgi:hypothetical protein
MALEMTANMYILETPQATLQSIYMTEQGHLFTSLLKHPTCACMDVANLHQRSVISCHHVKLKTCSIFTIICTAVLIDKRYQYEHIFINHHFNTSSNVSWCLIPDS